MIVDLTGDLIGEDENEGKTLKAIYDKYSPTRYDSEAATEVGAMKPYSRRCLTLIWSSSWQMGFEQGPVLV